MFYNSSPTSNIQNAITNVSSCSYIPACPTPKVVVVVEIAVPSLIMGPLLTTTTTTTTYNNYFVFVLVLVLLVQLPPEQNYFTKPID